ncbi:hypothetical protein ZIOFF_004126 [Zingiber officinale]|uniref:Serpin domain-containing protein n=2 Tax=Zingiber officinale TaxID=94328 RepID=A0A8J5I9T8_ZINOF|nr:hypothetical protein ZIOFF_004126 [Zingiber officinale]
MDLGESIARQTSFAIRLSMRVGAAVASDCNLVSSPLSVHLVLALVAAGSKGRTLDEILSLLGLSSGKLTDLNSLSSQIVSLVLADGSPSGGPRVSFANGVFVDSSVTLKPSFNDIVANTFKAEVKAVDFRTKSRFKTNLLHAPTFPSFSTLRAPVTMDLGESIARQTSFAIRLSMHVGAAVASDCNLVSSPLSVHLVLALAAAGSKGRTLDEILSLLGLSSGKLADLNSLSSQIVSLVLADGSPSGGPRVSFANGVFVDSSVTLKPSFNDIVANTFKAEVKAVDFRTKADVVADEINAWVENVTSNLIKELLPPGSVDSDTRLVLGNALYFKGSWTEKFDTSKTLNSEFYLLNGTSVEVAFMTSRKKQFLASYEGFKVLRLPYKQGEDKRSFSMYIFLPDAKDGLWSLEEKLNSESELLTRFLPMQKVEVNKFKLPKFKISFGFEASAVLKSLGLLSPFSGDADLSEMVDSPIGHSLYVSSIFHKSFIEVNEEGTEAAAASAAVVQLRSMPLRMDFDADHPFMFLIREDMTGVLLFTGHVLNPSIE